MNVLGLQSIPSPLHQVLICKTAILLQLCQFSNTIQGKVAYKGPYTISIRGMKIRLSKLQDDDKKAKKLKSERLSKGQKDIEKTLYYQGLPYVLKVICSELISRHLNNPFVDHLDIEKTQELIT